MDKLIFSLKIFIKTIHSSTYLCNGRQAIAGRHSVCFHALLAVGEAAERHRSRVVVDAMGAVQDLLAGGHVQLSYNCWEHIIMIIVISY